jgi:hypothetical protein
MYHAFPDIMRRNCRESSRLKTSPEKGNKTPLSGYDNYTDPMCSQRSIKFMDNGAKINFQIRMYFLE